MKRRNLVLSAPGQLELVTEDLPDVPEGGLLLETVATGLSAGTELAFVKGEHPALESTFDPELGLFATGADAAYPVTRLGYMEVARVAESRTPAFSVGEVVATPCGHATAHVSDPVREHVVRLPDDLDPLLGVYVAHMGPICVNGLLHAAADVAGPGATDLGDGVRGRLVVVVGAGVIGLFTALLAVEHGAAEVVVVDPDERRLAVAASLGLGTLHDPADPADAASAGDPARTLKTRWRHGPGDHGADVVFQCRGRSYALGTALRVLRPQGTVIDLAFYTGGADDVQLGTEFHHNGLRLVCAQIGRVPRGAAPFWDRARLSRETVRLLRSRGSDVREHLITDVVDIEEAPGLMVAVGARERHVLTAVFTVSHDIV